MRKFVKIAREQDIGVRLVSGMKPDQQEVKNVHDVDKRCTLFTSR